jgi:hypothetical protein
MKQCEARPLRSSNFEGNLTKWTFVEDIVDVFTVGKLNQKERARQILLCFA